MQHSIRRTCTALALSASIALPVFCPIAHAAPHRGGGKPSNGTSNRPAPTPGAREVKMLETALGRTLTATEIAAISAAASAQKTALDAANTTFQSALTNLFSLDSGQSVTVTQQGCRKGGDVLSALAKALGRDLTAEEIAAVNALQATRDAAIAAAMADYKTAVAAAVGLTVDELDAKIQAARPANGGGGGRGGHR